MGEQADRVAHAAAMGAIRTLSRLSVQAHDALQGAAYGAIQGALESGNDPGEVADAVVEAAIEVAAELGVSEEEAATAARAGILRAASVAGGDSLAAVQRAIHEDPVEADPE